jgi:hypothetical protein
LEYCRKTTQHPSTLPLLNTHSTSIHRSIHTYTRHKKDQSSYCLSSYPTPKTMPSIASIAIGGLMSLSLVANALPQITRSGRYLYEPDGTRFYIKVGSMSRSMTNLTCRVWHINLKAPSQSKVPPTLKSESCLCSRNQCADYASGGFPEPYVPTALSGLYADSLARLSSTPFPQLPTVPGISHTSSSSA